ncbi:MAG: hypothetical protein WD597_00405 [Balneolaceae bacterium]
MNTLISASNNKNITREESIQNKEYALILLTSSTCSFSNNQELIKIFKELKKQINNKTISENVGFTAIGISLETDPLNGLSHLKKYGKFNEIIIGNNWSNLGAIRYIFNDIKGYAITPQVLVTVREYKMIGSDTFSKQRAGIVNEYAVIRKVGTDQIKLWKEEGFSFQIEEK